MVSQTKARSKDILNHVLDNVFELDKDHVMRKALKDNAIDNILVLLDWKECDLEMLHFSVKTKNEDTGEVTMDTHPLGKTYTNLLIIFKAYVGVKFPNIKSIDVQDWFDIDSDDFDAFRVSRNYEPNVKTKPPPTLNPNKAKDPVSDFKRGIKRDQSLFPTLKDERQWDTYKRSTKAQATAQGVSEVLNPNYSPVSFDDKKLFDLKQQYMYAVAEKTLLTDIGKSAVRKHESNFDAQAVYKELFEQMEKSTKASLNSTNLLKYITTVKLGDGTWKGNTESFLLHWLDQARLYNSMVDHNFELNDFMLKVLIENAVNPIEELRAVKVQEEQLKVHDGKELTYDQYLGLLTSAMQQYDKSKSVHKSNMPTRHVHAHDIDDEQVYETYDIDSQVDTIIANKHNVDDRPLLPKEIYDKLDYEGKQAWRKFPIEAKRVILDMKLRGEKVSNPSLPVFHPKSKLKVNLHDMSAHDFIQVYLTDSSSDDDPSDNQESSAQHDDQSDQEASEKNQSLAANKTDRSKLLTPQDIRRVLSTKVKDSNTHKSDSQTSKSKESLIKQLLGVNVHHTYNVSSHKTTEDHALVDRGANGGIGGADVTLIELSNRTVNVSGIDDHEMNNVPIATVGV